MAKILLVIGNGFDRKLGLNSTYKDFLESDFYSKKMNDIKAIHKRIGKLLYDQYPQKLDYFIDNQFNSFGDLNFWNLFFGLSKHLNLNADYETWADFEKSIHDFLRNINKEVSITKIVQCKELSHSKFGKDDTLDYLIIIYIYLSQKHAISKNYKDDYSLLLSDLKSFEREFGKYIELESSSKHYLTDCSEL